MSVPGAPEMTLYLPFPGKTYSFHLSQGVRDLKSEKGYFYTWNFEHEFKLQRLCTRFVFRLKHFLKQGTPLFSSTEPQARQEAQPN